MITAPLTFNEVIDCAAPLSTPAMSGTGSLVASCGESLCFLTVETGGGSAEPEDVFHSSSLSLESTPRAMALHRPTLVASEAAAAGESLSLSLSLSLFLSLSLSLFSSLSFPLSPFLSLSLSLSPI